MRIEKRFYVGSASMLNRENWRHLTVEEAVEHAKELCEESDAPQIVVEIVRLIKIEKPVTVLKFGAEVVQDDKV